MNDSPHYDAVVVGARCAGAATAMLLARRGLRILALERQEQGTDTLSTHALMRCAVLLLGRWGVLDRILAAGTPLIRTTSFNYAGREIEIPIKPSADVEGLVAPRRFVLDRVLQEAAQQAGAEIRYGTAVSGVIRTPQGRICGIVAGRTGEVPMTVTADLVIGADGRHSVVARDVAASLRWVGQHQTATLYAYWEGLSGQGYEWHFRPGLASGVIPTDGGLSCVFASLPAARFGEACRHGAQAAYRALVEASSPSLFASLAGARQTGRVRGFLGQAAHLRQAFGPGWALVGDAGYFKDPLTAHGITDALRDAELLAAAVVAGGEEALRAYEGLRDELSRPLFEVTDRIASFDWSMAELETLHGALNAAMRTECAFMAAMPSVVAESTSLIV
jgi:flavin-dependent dehydrogenase